MIPSVFVVLESLPRNSNGKLDRARLPAPDPDPTKRRAPVEPRNDTEAALAEIWQHLLHVDSISIEDNFFELGGDSILSIQMVGRARQRGLAITARQLFEHQTIAALAAVTAPAPPAQAVPISGAEFPLTPVQQWFFALNYANPGRWTHALVLAMCEPFEQAAMESAFAAVLRHHDLLRICFSREEDGWHQTIASKSPKPSVARIKLLSESGQLAEVRRIANESAEIDLQSGQMLKLIWAEAPGAGQGYLIAVMSHLIADGISWRILLEDLELSYRQAVSREQIALPPRTSSLAEWAHRLKGYAQSQSVWAEADYWISLFQNPTMVLPADEPGGDGREQTSASLQIVFGETITDALWRHAAPAYRTGIEDFILTALALTLARWAGDTRVLIDVDRHGREPVLEGVDLTRTLGWFTSVTPHVVSVDPEAALVANLKAIKEQLRQAPHGGLHYGLLRYLDESNENASKLRELPQAQILFNYMGRLDSSFGGGKLFSLADGEVLGGRDPNWQRPYELSINADILEHCLRITWDYSSRRYHRSTIEALARGCKETLQTLAAHCLLPDTGGYTPSDFPLARLGQNELDQFFDKVRGIEDVYPLTPLQQGILFHALYAPGSGTYVEQLSCTLEGSLDVAAFAAAWRQVVGSHPILRSSFLWEGLSVPLQAVHAEVLLPIEEQDWRRLTPSEQTRRRAAISRRTGC